VVRILVIFYKLNFFFHFPSFILISSLDYFLLFSVISNISCVNNHIVRRQFIITLSSLFFDDDGDDNDWERYADQHETFWGPLKLITLWLIERKLELLNILILWHNHSNSRIRNTPLQVRILDFEHCFLQFGMFSS
jgi:hypothetical protein